MVRAKTLVQGLVKPEPSIPITVPLPGQHLLAIQILPTCFHPIGKHYIASPPVLSETLLFVLSFTELYCYLYMPVPDFHFFWALLCFPNTNLNFTLGSRTTEVIFGNASQVT